MSSSINAACSVQTCPPSVGSFPADNVLDTTPVVSSGVSSLMSTDVAPVLFLSSFSGSLSTVSSVRLACQVLWLYVRDCVSKQQPLTRAQLQDTLGVFAKQVEATPSAISSLLPIIAHAPFDVLAAREGGVDVFVRVVRKLIAALLSGELWVGAPTAPCSLAALMCFILMHAIEGHVSASDAVTALMEIGADINAVDARGATTLMFAAKAGHTALARALIAAGADVDVLAVDGNTSLLRAVECQEAEMVQMLIDAKANVQARACDYHRYWPLAVASQRGHMSIVQMLLGAKADVEDVDSRGYKPLITAASAGHADVVRVLTKAGIAFDIDDASTALWQAIANNHVAVVKVLIDLGVDVCAHDCRGNTPLMRAAGKRNVEMVQLLLDSNADVEQRSKMGSTPLSWAADEGELAIVQVLLAAKANVNSVDKADDYSPLMIAAANGHAEVVQMMVNAAEITAKHASVALVSAMETADVDVVEILLEARADLSERDADGNTTLTSAVRHEQDKMVQLLLSAKANIEDKDVMGCTPLLWAVEGGDEATLQILLSAKANIECKNNNGETPMSIAMNTGNGAILQMLIDAGLVLDEVQQDAFLLHAVERDHVEMVEVLLNIRADVNVQDIDGNTALIVAVDGDASVEMVQKLINAKADIDEKNDMGATPLIEAASMDMEQLSIVQALLAAKADVENVDNDGCTALMKAAKMGHVAVLYALVEDYPETLTGTDTGKSPYSADDDEGVYTGIPVWAHANTEDHHCEF